MTWLKIGDEFSDECWTLSDAAFRLHVQGLSWSMQKLNDQRFPRDDIRRFANRPEALEELVERGYWRLEGDEVVIVHHAGYQRSAAEVIAAQERGRVNGAKSNGRPKKTKVGLPAANPDRNPQGQDRTGQALEGEPMLSVVRDQPDHSAAASSWPAVRQPGSGGVA